MTSEEAGRASDEPLFAPSRSRRRGLELGRQALGERVERRDPTWLCDLRAGDRRRSASRHDRRRFDRDSRELRRSSNLERTQGVGSEGDDDVVVADAGDSEDLLES